MDWNWFFSSIAQSAAAIVAIFGGFIITKIISNQADFHRKKAEVSECIRACLRLVNHGETVGFLYIESLSKQNGLHSVEMNIYKDNPVKNAEQYYLTANFSLYADRQEIINSINKLIDNFHNNPDKPLTRIGVLSGDSAATKFHTDKRNAEESVNKFIIDVNSQSLLARTLANEIRNNPYSSSLVAVAITAIILLFYGGVIYPLSFMPMAIGNDPVLSLSAFWDILFSLRGAMMAIISTIFTLIMLTFVIINMRMKFNSDNITELEHYSLAEAFSAYLKRARDNAEFRNAHA